MNDRVGSQLHSTPAKLVALSPRPEAKVQYNINTLYEYAPGYLPEQCFYGTVPRVVLGIVQILTEEAKMPLIRRQPNSRQGPFEFFRLRCFAGAR